MSPHPALKSFLNKHQVCSRLTHPKIFCRVVKILSLTYLTGGPWKELRLSWAVVCGNDVSTSTQTATGSSVGLWCLSLLPLRLLLTGRLRQEDLQSWSQSEWRSGNPVSRRKEILVSNVMLLGGKLSLETVAFVSGICTQLKGPHLLIFSQCDNGRSNRSETWKVLPRARVYWVVLTVDFRLPGPRGLWVSNLVLTSNPFLSELFLVNVGKVLCF